MSPDHQHILYLAAAAVGTSLEDIRAHRKGARSSRRVYQRAMLAYILRQTGLSLPDIGQMLNRDHGAIHNLLRKMEGEKKWLAEAKMLAKTLGVT